MPFGSAVCGFFGLGDGSHDHIPADDSDADMEMDDDEDDMVIAAAAVAAAAAAAAAAAGEDEVETEQQLQQRLLDGDVQRAKRDKLSSNTIGSYVNSIIAILMWLNVNHPNVISDKFRSSGRGLHGQPFTAANLKRILLTDFIPIPDPDTDEPPFSLDMSDGAFNIDQHFLHFIASRRKENGSIPCKNRHRSALRYLFSKYKRKIGEWWSEVETAFKGWERQLASHKQRGIGKATTGKERMGFQFYKEFALLCLRSKSVCHAMTHLTLVLSWNLLCRVSNSVTIRESHLRWINDALGVYYPKMKNDQDGARTHDYRHVYANPLNPAICPILALALYWVCNRPSEGSTASVPGESPALFPSQGEGGHLPQADDGRAVEQGWRKAAA
jgi:hypothetical protein